MITLKELKEQHSYLTEEEQISLLKYKNSHYEIYNHYLMTGMVPKNNLINDEKEIKKDIANILSAMKKYKENHKDKKYHVYRGISLDNEKDKIIHQLSFMSTTSNVEITFKFLRQSECCIFDIIVRDESILYFDFNDSEKEILFEPGLSLIIFDTNDKIYQKKKYKIHNCNMVKQLNERQINEIKKQNAEKTKKQDIIEEKLNQIRTQIQYDDDDDDSWLEGGIKSKTRRSKTRRSKTTTRYRRKNRM